MRYLAIPTAAAAAILLAGLAHADPVSPGGNPAYPSAGSPMNAPTVAEQLAKTPGTSANAVFPAAGAPLNAPSPQEQLKKTPGSSANDVFPTADAPLRDRKD